MELKKIEEVAIYCLVGNTVLMMVMDILPLNFAKKETKLKYKKDEIKK